MISYLEFLLYLVFPQSLLNLLIYFSNFLMKFSTLNTSLGDSSLSPSSSLYVVSKGEGGKYPNKFKRVFSGGGVDFPII
jgi:hypothetical protein